MDPFEEFEFKPLTEGLGFHKKAEKLKQDIQLTNLSEEKTSRTVPEPPPAEMLKAGMSVDRNLNRDDELDLTAPRPASKSISDLIAALPPSLDFLEDGPAPEKSAETTAESGLHYPFLSPRKRSAPAAKSTSAVKSSAAETRPQIFQPLGRSDYQTGDTKPTDKTSFRAPTPGTAAVLPNSTLNQGPLSARVNTPPTPTFKAPLKNPIVPVEEAPARAQTPIEKPKKVEKRALAAASRESKKVSASFAAAILDAMAITGVATIFLVIILVITKIDLIAMLSHAKTDLSTMFHLALLFLIVMQMYMLSARCFFGATVGEWAFDLQMGSDEERARVTYPIKVIWRMALVLATGFFPLPLLSKLFGRDLLALLGGPQLTSRPH